MLGNVQECPGMESQFRPPQCSLDRERGKWRSFSFACPPSVTILEPAARNGILRSGIVRVKAALLARCVWMGVLAPLRSATAALEYFLWVRSALPRSKHSRNRCTDLAANAQPREEGIRFTPSLVLVWGKRCPAVARRCLEHHEASRGTASSGRMISAVQHELVTKRRRFCPAKMRQMTRQAACSFRCSKGNCHTHKDASARDDRTQHRMARPRF